MNELHAWLVGDMSPRARVVTALLPALVAMGYFLLGYVAYNIRALIWGVPREYTNETRRSSALVGYHLRFYFFWVINPLWKLVLKSGLSANAVTGIAAGLGLGAALAAGFGRFALAGWLFIFSGILDTMDGRLARARGQESPAGAAIDSILDRYTDSLMLFGLGFYYRDSWVILPVFLALLGTSVTPYVRAKSEALGYPLADGLMQRAERIMYLGGTVALSPIFEALVFPNDPRPVHWVAALGVVFLAVTSNITGISRFASLVRTIKGTRAASNVARDRDRAA